MGKIGGGSTQNIPDRQRILYEAVVNDVIVNPAIDLEKNPANDPEVTLRESLMAGKNKVINTTLVNKMPRNSIIATIVSDREGWSPKLEIFYPFFSGHLSLPVKPGEKIWVIYDSVKRTKSGKGYWITRIVTSENIDDINYTHADREGLYVSKNSTADSPMAAQTGITNITLDEALSFPTGGPSQKNNTFSDPERYNAIVDSSTSYLDNFIGEPIPRISKRAGDLLLQGSNNASILIGQKMGMIDSPPLADTGTIDIVTGLGQTEETSAIASNPNSRGYDEIVKVPELSSLASNPLEGKPDFINDLSRVYVSMNASCDESFGLSFTYASSVADAPYIVAKSDEVRLIGRGSVRAKSETGNTQLTLLASGDAALVGSRVFLGSSDTEHTSDLTDEHQHVVKGDDLITAINNFADAMSLSLGTGAKCGNLTSDLTTAAAITQACTTFKSESLLSLSDVVHTE